MANTLGIVEINPVAGQGNRSPLELAGRRFGGQTLLQWVVRRATDAQLLDCVVVLCGDSSPQHMLAQWTPADVPLIASAEKDSTSRLAATIKSFQADAVVRIRLDNPFVDPALIDRLVTSAQSTANCDYVGFCRRDGRPTALSCLGMSAQWCRAEAIQRADRQAKAEQRNDPIGFVMSHPESFQLRLIPLPVGLDRDDVRLTLDVEEDWEHAQEIYDALGPESLDWQRIAGLLSQQPSIRQRMADLNRTQVHS